MAQGDFLAAEREADGTEKTEEESSQGTATAKLTAGPSERGSEAISEQLMMMENPQSRATTNLKRDETM